MSTLTWGIKTSLLGYVRGMADGTVEASSGATETPDGFTFPGEGLRFTGAVTLVAHGGMMHVVVAVPGLVERDGRWMLEIADPDDADIRLPFATVGSFDGRAGTDIALTTAGADLFFGPYTAGTRFDDLVVAD